MTRASEETLFARALEMPPVDRAAFLERACGHDSALRDRVTALLAAHDAPTDYFNEIEKAADDAAPGTGRVAPLRDGSVDRRIGRYKLLQKIGEGGFGIVYMAEQEEPVRRKVALKIIKPGMDTKAVVARFEAERQALAMMDHPCIAQVFDGGAVEERDDRGEVIGERPYFVMELVRGVPITDYCDQNRLPTRARLELFVSVCHAVQHAHQKGIIHRDIKPSNVMVTLHDGKPVVKVIDFGIAKAIHQRLTERTMFTEFGQMIGTPQYMSPEQAEMSGLDVDTRSDVYSLSVLLYELLTETTPLEAESLRAVGYAEIQRMIREQEPPKPSRRVSTAGEMRTAIAEHRSVSPDRLHRELAGDLDWIVMKGLEKDRQRRYESPVELARDIQRSLEEQPVLAGPPSWGYRLSKFARRNSRRLVAAAIATTLVLTAGAWAVANWVDRQSRIAEASDALTEAIDTASLELNRAVTAPVGHADDWLTARASRQRISDVLESQEVSEEVEIRAAAFLQRFDEEDGRRRLATEIEDLIINQGTHKDRESWETMERQFRELFKARGIDFDDLTPVEVSEHIRAHPAAERLADALELWIATKGQLSSLTGERLTAADMQPWADALYAADPDPLRTGIRKIIYEGRPAQHRDVETLAAGVDLDSLEPRTLSWLAVVFLLAGDVERSNELHQFALRKHPDDLMLNFEFAMNLGGQGRWEHAIRYYMRCTAIRPDVSGVWRGLGEALRRHGELAESRDALLRAVELRPEHAATRIELALTVLEMKDYDAVMKATREAIELGSADPVAHACLGRALMLNGWHAEAAETLTRAVELADGRPILDWPVADWLQTCRERAPGPAGSSGS